MFLKKKLKSKIFAHYYYYVLYYPIMYKKLQQQAKDHIIDWLNSNPNNLVFDIDTTTLETTIIKCQRHSENIKIVIGETIIPNYVLGSIGNIISSSIKFYLSSVWIYAVRSLITDVFKIYGFDVVKNSNLSSDFQIMNIESHIYEVYNNKTQKYDIIVPYFEYRHLFAQKMINKCPLTILLNPIQYFGCCSLVIKKHNLNISQTVGMYELFLAKFPEMNDELFNNYCILYIILENYYKDIKFLILLKLIELY